MTHVPKYSCTCTLFLLLLCSLTHGSLPTVSFSCVSILASGWNLEPTLKPGTLSWSVGLCLAHGQRYSSWPFPILPLAKGPASTDWHWSCDAPALSDMECSCPGPYIVQWPRVRALESDRLGLYSTSLISNLSEDSHLICKLQLRVNLYTMRIKR